METIYWRKVFVKIHYMNILKKTIFSLNMPGNSITRIALLSRSLLCSSEKHNNNWTIKSRLSRRPFFAAGKPPIKQKMASGQNWLGIPFQAFFCRLSSLQTIIMLMVINYFQTSGIFFAFFGIVRILNRLMLKAQEPLYFFVHKLPTSFHVNTIWSAYLVTKKSLTDNRPFNFFLNTKYYRTFEKTPLFALRL